MIPHRIHIISNFLYLFVKMTPKEKLSAGIRSFTTVGGEFADKKTLRKKPLLYRIEPLAS